jgi:hypothetical protein
MIDSAGHDILMDIGAGFEQSPEARALAGILGYWAPEVLAGAAQERQRAGKLGLSCSRLQGEHSSIQAS